MHFQYDKQAPYGEEAEEEDPEEVGRRIASRCLPPSTGWQKEWRRRESEGGGRRHLCLPRGREGEVKELLGRGNYHCNALLTPPLWLSDG